MLDKVIKMIEKHNMFSHRERVIVGVSGGCDSVSLLYMLKELPYDLSLHVVHINHMLRGENADMDAEYVKRICTDLDVEFTIISEDVAKLAREYKISVEEAGRNVRYDNFFKLAKLHNCTKVAVAHHADDQAETILMRLLRGSGLKGLTGMPEVRMEAGVTIVRPFIGLRRSEIEEYCKINGIVPRIDESNQDPKYLRNKVRNELIPLMVEEYNPSIVENLVKTAEILKEDEEYLDSIADKSYHDCLKDDGHLDISKLKLLHSSMLRRVLMKAYERAQKSSDFTFAQIREMENLVRNNKMGTSLNLSNNFVAAIEYEGLKIYEIADDTEKDTIFFMPGDNILWQGKNITSRVVDCTFSSSVNNISIADIAGLEASGAVSNWAAFDFDKLHGPFVVREKTDGEKMIPFGMSSLKLLSDIFIDEKISKRVRSECPLICSGNDILWLCGVKTSDVARVTQDTKKLFIIEYSN